MMDLSDEKKRFLDSEGHVISFGGPGSGKTTAALLLSERIVSQKILSQKQTILFLSFANATVSRVKEQAKKMGVVALSNNQLKISTYHSFFWEILKSHSYLLNGKRPIRILPPPEAAAQFAEINGEKEKKFEIERIFNEEGVIHFDLFALKSGDLLEKSTRLLNILSRKYPIIILDEFQDTNTDEWRFISLLGRRSRLIALADPEQRIYEFRGAHPSRISDFNSLFTPSSFDFSNENHRSSGSDILDFGNDLLTKRLKKKYKNVTINYYPFRKGAFHLDLKIEVIKAIRRLNSSKIEDWSLAVLVPTKSLMLQVSDYLEQSQKIGNRTYPRISHHVALETAGPSLAAILIANLMAAKNDTSTFNQLILDISNHIRGRNGDKPPSQANLKLSIALQEYIQTEKVRGKNRISLISTCKELVKKASEITHTGDAIIDWRNIRNLLRGKQIDTLDRIFSDSTYLRLLRKGSTLQAGMQNLWRNTGSYMTCAEIVRNALTQEHFSSTVQTAKGISVMTMHKSKGKEFEEVIIYEGIYRDRIVHSDADERKKHQSLLALRVAVTRGKQAVNILTPSSDPCEFF